MPWLRSSANKVQTNVFCCCLIVNYGVALHRTCYTIVCIVTVPGMGFFGGLMFGPGIFLGFAGSPRDCLGSRVIPSTPPPLPGVSPLVLINCVRNRVRPTVNKPSKELVP